MIDRLRSWARALKTQLLTLWHCRSHPETPLAARLLAVLVLAYALSPIDLIPDFIPVLGYLDDLILVPLGILLVLRLLPAQVLADAQRQAELGMAEDRRKPANYYAAAAIVVVWASLAYWGWRHFAN